jgi:hypothetical protein
MKTASVFCPNGPFKIYSEGSISLYVEDGKKKIEAINMIHGGIQINSQTGLKSYI